MNPMLINSKHFAGKIAPPKQISNKKKEMLANWVGFRAGVEKKSVYVTVWFRIHMQLSDVKS